MANRIVVYEPSGGVVSGQVTEVARSASPYKYKDTNHLIDPDISDVSGVSKIYWKVSGEPPVLVEMTQEETGYIDQAYHLNDYRIKDRTEIMTAIMHGCLAISQDCFNRMVDTYDKCPKFSLALDTPNYLLARAWGAAILAKRVSDGEITQEQSDELWNVVDSRVPNFEV